MKKSIAMLLTATALSCSSLAFDVPIASAMRQIVEGDGQCPWGEGSPISESYAESEALAHAKADAVQKATIFFEGMTESKNGRISHDTINLVCATIAEDAKIKPEYRRESMGSGVFLTRCHIVVAVDTDEAEKMILMGLSRL